MGCMLQGDFVEEIDPAPWEPCGADEGCVPPGRVCTSDGAGTGIIACVDDGFANIYRESTGMHELEEVRKEG